MKKYLYILSFFFALLLVFSDKGLGQTYTQSTTTYSWDAPATNISTTSCDDCRYNTVALPFNFTYFGTVYASGTNVDVSTNGWLSFTSPQASSYWVNACLPSASAPMNLIAAYWDDLYFYYTCGPTTFRYTTIGTTPNRRFVIAWTAFSPTGNTSCASYVYTEIKLFETTNVIEVHLQSNALGSSGAIGIENSTGTVGYQAICNTATTNGTAWQWTPNTNTITTNTAIAGSPFCAGTSVNVPFAITGTFTGGNIFTAQLSNSAGSFAAPTSIGSLTQTTAGTIAATIPAGTASGAGYRIRVVSSSPVVTGSDNTVNLTVNALATPGTFQYANGTTQAICAANTISCTNVVAPTAGSGVLTTVWYCGEWLSGPVGSGGTYGNWKESTLGNISGTTSSANLNTAAGGGAGTATALTNYNPQSDFPGKTYFYIIRRGYNSNCGPCVGGCQDQMFYLTVNALPTVAGITGATDVCNGGSTLAFTDATGGGTWSITNGTGSASITAGGVATGTAAGSVTVNYAVTVSGCTSTVTTPLSVDVLPVVPAIGGGAASVCVGSSTPAFSDATGGGTWSITNGTGSATINSSGVATGTGVGNVTVNYAVTNICGTTTKTQALSVTASAVVNAGPDQYLCTGTVLATMAATGSGSWTKISGAACTITAPGNLINNTITGLASGTYVFRWTTGCGYDDVVVIIK